MPTVVLDYLKQFGMAVSVPAALLALVAFVGGLTFVTESVKRFTLRDGTRRSAAHFFYCTRSATAAILFFAATIILATITFAPYPEYWNQIAAYVLVFLFGGGVGAAELISRFRDDPIRAVQTVPGSFYIALNAAASAVALYLIYVFHDSLGFHDVTTATPARPWSSDPINLVKAVLLAGFSALLFFRTSIFKYRTGDSELPIGPSIVLDTLLNAADRAVDRVMAQPRAKFVTELMGVISFEKAAVILPSHCLALMQNVSNEESQRIASVVNQLRADAKMPDKIKSLNLGLALLNVLGMQVLRTAVDSLKRDLQTDRQANTDLVRDATAAVKAVSFEPARRMLPRYCFALWPDVSNEAQQKLGLDLKALSEIRDVSDQYKSLVLGIRVAQLTDVDTLKKAVSDLSESIKFGSPGAEALAALTLDTPGPGDLGAAAAAASPPPTAGGPSAAASEADTSRSTAVGAPKAVSPPEQPDPLAAGLTPAASDVANGGNGGAETRQATSDPGKTPSETERQIGSDTKTGRSLQ